MVETENENRTKKPFYKKVWFWVVIAVVVVAVIGGIFGEKGSQPSQDVISLSPGAKNTPSGVKSTPSGDKVGPGNKIRGDGWDLSLLSVTTRTEVGDAFTKETAKSGNVFLILFMEAENTSAEDGYFNRLYFEAYVDTYAVNQSVLFTDIDDQGTISGDVAAGKKIKGYLAYEVPEDWQEFEITYKDGVVFADKIATFTVTPDDIT